MYLNCTGNFEVLATVSNLNTCGIFTCLGSTDPPALSYSLLRIYVDRIYYIPFLKVGQASIHGSTTTAPREMASCLSREQHASIIMFIPYYYIHASSEMRSQKMVYVVIRNRTRAHTKTESKRPNENFDLLFVHMFEFF